jgi:hypothetical protein
MNGLNMASLRLGEACVNAQHARHDAPTETNLCVGAKHASPSSSEPQPEPKLLEPTGNPA